MSLLCDLTDGEYVPFLHSLGVETYNKSFEWMLNDSEFSGVLLWLYNNLDQNNSLSAREEYRYAELEKSGCLLSSEDLESTIAAIQTQHPGISLPGDKEALNNVKCDINTHKERLTMLERHENVYKDLIKQNNLINCELNLEISKLNSARQQCVDDEAAAAAKCLSLESEVESLTEEVVDIITDTLEMYSNCHADKDIAKKFLTFAPLESYRQSQALFKAHFDLYTSKKLVKKPNDTLTADDIKEILLDAKAMEERLTEAVYEYIDAKVQLSGEQAKLALVNNYNAVHPSQVAIMSLEAQSALDLLLQEESILNQQVQAAVKEMVVSRTTLAVDSTTRAALAIREETLADLCHLVDTCRAGAALDRVLYRALRHELRAVEDVTQFAANLGRHLQGEAVAVRDRLEYMNEICAEQLSCEQNLQSSDLLTNTLISILGPANNDGATLMRLYCDLQSRMKEAYEDIKEAYRSKEHALLEAQQAMQPLRQLLWSGCTKQPACWDRGVASLNHSLKQKTETVEKRVAEITSNFTTVKNGDKQNLRRLWQWFLSDHQRLQAATKIMSPTNYNR